MEILISFVKFIIIFLIISLTSKQMGEFFAKLHLPLITGFLFTGILTGPYILKIITLDCVSNLEFIDQISLGIIAFAAGNELYLKDIRTRMRSILYNTFGHFFFIFTFSSLVVFYFSDYIPFMSKMNNGEIFAVAILCGSILIARSPSSAIAIIKELRAKGPFTQTILGVTIIMDVFVIVLFAICTSIVDAKFLKLPFNFSFVLLIISELILCIILGIILGKVLQFVLSRKLGSNIIISSIIVIGYAVFPLTHLLDFKIKEYFGVLILLEPLLICMIGSFYITNYTVYRDDMSLILSKVEPSIYIMFFTLTGASLDITLISSIWKITLILFFVRLFGIFAGGLIGGSIAGDKMEYNYLSWMGHITQAGVGLGLAKEVADKFPHWGTDFATLMISIIVINQILGPVFFKIAVSRTGEAHPKAKKSDKHLIHNALIYGFTNNSVALARQLISHDWNVKIACPEEKWFKLKEFNDLEILTFKEINLETLKKHGANKVGAIVTMLPDEANLEICSIAYENFGEANLIVHLNEWEKYEDFDELDAFIVSPTTAIVSLLDHYVRSPSAVSLLLGLEEEQDIIEIIVENPDYQDLNLRDLSLPSDTLVLSIKRNGKMLVVHSYVHLKLGDILTISGTEGSLDEISLMLSEV